MPPSLPFRVTALGAEMVQIVRSRKNTAFPQVNPQRQIGADYANVKSKKIYIFKIRNNNLSLRILTSTLKSMGKIHDLSKT